MPRTMGTVGYPLFRRGSQNPSFLSGLLNHLLWGLRSHAPAPTLTQDTAAPKHKANCLLLQGALKDSGWACCAERLMGEAGGDLF